MHETSGETIIKLQRQENTHTHTHGRHTHTHTYVCIVGYTLMMAFARSGVIMRTHMSCFANMSVMVVVCANERTEKGKWFDELVSAETARCNSSCQSFA